MLIFFLGQKVPSSLCIISKWSFCASHTGHICHCKLCNASWEQNSLSKEKRSNKGTQLKHIFILHIHSQNSLIKPSATQYRLNYVTNKKCKEMKFIFMERKELRHLKTFYYTKGKFFLAFLLKKGTFSTLLCTPLSGIPDKIKY